MIGSRKTPLRKPNRGEGIVSKKPRPKSVYDFLVFSSIVLLFNCMVVLFPALRDIHCTSMARYSLFVLKVPLNSYKPKPIIVNISNCTWLKGPDNSKETFNWSHALNSFLPT